MSTAMIWLLLFIVVALALLIAALTKTKFTVQKISIIGIMAALSFVAYEFFRIPNVLGTGSSFHLGNTFTALTALLLDGVSGGLAGAIGLALADIMAGDPGYAVTTFILKFIIGLVCGGVAHRIIHLRSFPTGSTLQVWICNNGNDAEPTWEDITTKALTSQKHFFTNQTKTAASWGVKIKVKLLRGSAEGDCYIQSVGGNFA